MPREAAEYKLQNGQSVFIEADVPTDYSEQKVSIFGGKNKDKGSPPNLSAAIDRVMPALSDVFEKVRSQSFRPDEVELEVGIKFVGEAGVVIARASTEANLVVKLTWDNRKQK